MGSYLNRKPWFIVSPTFVFEYKTYVGRYLYHKNWIFWKSELLPEMASSLKRLVHTLLQECGVVSYCFVSTFITNYERNTDGERSVTDTKNRYIYSYKNHFQFFRLQTLEYSSVAKIACCTLNWSGTSFMKNIKCSSFFRKFHYHVVEEIEQLLRMYKKCVNCTYVSI